MKLASRTNITMVAGCSSACRALKDWRDFKTSASVWLLQALIRIPFAVFFLWQLEANSAYDVISFNFEL